MAAGKVSPMGELRSVTLYCSSSRSLDPHFAVAARAAGELIARRGLTLVYGGGGLGLMGEAARACKAAGGRVEGIITRKFLDLEQGWLGCDELVVVETMRERKRLLIERADGFLVLPGGMGTFEEFFETLVGRQIGDHAKPIAVLDDHGYYLPLQSLIEHSIREKFAREAVREVLHFGTDLETLLDWLAAECVAPVHADPDRFLPMGPKRSDAPGAEVR
ncbi:MAG: TIGR00730 family Rossman fold protein [Planctomycetota bacterium]